MAYETKIDKMHKAATANTYARLFGKKATEDEDDDTVYCEICGMPHEHHVSGIITEECAECFAKLHPKKGRK